MAAILQLIIACIDKLNLSSLVEAQAELIRSRAYWNSVNAFIPHIIFGGLVLIGLIAVVGYEIYLTKSERHDNYYERR